MCMEDIRIGRHIKTMSHFFTTTLAPTLMVDGERKRVVLILTPSPGETYSISPNPNMVAGEGITVGDRNGSVILNIQNAGDFITKPLYAVAVIGATRVGWVEGLLEAE